MKKQEEFIQEKFDLTTIITTAIKIPGVKVNRELFLRDQFQELSKDKIEKIVDSGPVEAKISREEIKKKANRITKERSLASSGVSFMAGLPGGIGMAAAIPADILQFYGTALRMAQELAYLYGEKDMWCEGTVDAEKVTNQMILYCGVMLGATGAASSVRVMSSALAKQIAKKLPQKALTKTFYYPIIKSIAKFFGVSITKKTFANGVSKVVPVVGGVISGGITLASMMPMGNRLVKTLDKAHFDYSEKEYNKDIIIINQVIKEQEEKSAEEIKNQKSNKNEQLAQIKEAKELFDNGAITEEEFSEIKEKIIEKNIGV